ncbi:Neuroendocrine convertase 2 [Eumeta japonica]|uniref:Neuroendocrine convertase 2 n=1 Tax=Eumeta variegata TaxID=151549 RepID=A0A4C1TG20_EUMVA|nr:Neuroendocrine convertase 2 [Eumeta japonica]
MGVHTAVQQTGFKRVKRGFRPLRLPETQPASEPRDPYFPLQWYLKNTGQNGGKPKLDLNVEAAWAQGYTGINVTTAIMDDGVDYMHPDLKFNYVELPFAQNLIPIGLKLEKENHLSPNRGSGSAPRDARAVGGGRTKGRKPEDRYGRAPERLGLGWETPPRLYDQSDTETINDYIFPRMPRPHTTSAATIHTRTRDTPTTGLTGDDSPHGRSAATALHIFIFIYGRYSQGVGLRHERTYGERTKRWNIEASVIATACADAPRTERIHLYYFDILRMDTTFSSYPFQLLFSGAGAEFAQSFADCGSIGAAVREGRGTQYGEDICDDNNKGGCVSSFQYKIPTENTAQPTFKKKNF